MKQQIEVIIDKNGDVSIDLLNFKGKGCSDVSSKLAKALGKIKKTNEKCEYWQQETEAKQQIKQL